MEFKENMTEQEFEKAIQSATDKVRTEYSAKLNDLKTQLPKQKSDAELELEQRISALEAKEKQLNQKEKQLLVSNELKSKGLPSELSSYFNLDGVEDVTTMIDEVHALFQGNQVDYTPSNHKVNTDSVTKEQFHHMGYMERLELSKTNPHLYEKLSN